MDQWPTNQLESMTRTNLEDCKRFQLLADELVQMAQEDQRAIKNGLKKAEIEPLFKRNAERLKAIVSEIGWPSIPKVGRQASMWAWLLVQHADHDLEFQKQCLKMMKHLPEGEIQKKHIAYLDDRVRVNECRPQLYGTQFYMDEAGVFGPRPIEDPDNLD